MRAVAVNALPGLYGTTANSRCRRHVSKQFPVAALGPRLPVLVRYHEVDSHVFVAAYSEERRAGYGGIELTGHEGEREADTCLVKHGHKRAGGDCEENKPALASVSHVRLWGVQYG